jgi:hypothetical protein
MCGPTGRDDRRRRYGRGRIVDEEGQRLRTVGKARAANLAAKRSEIKEAIKKVEIIDPASRQGWGRGR